MSQLKEQLPKTAEVIEQGKQQALHVGAQIYISKGADVIVNTALGIAAPDVPMQTDTLMLWRSAAKPITAIAVGQQFDAGRLHWDDRVASHIPEFGKHGKEALTLRHLLTHTSGFRQADKISESLDWAETLRQICETPLEPDWEPGKKAGYHLQSSWHVLAEVVHRLDGRPFEHYARDEILLPLGMRDTWIGMPREQYRAYGNRIGYLYVTDKDPPAPHPYRDSEEACAACRPGSNGRGPVHELGRFYESLLALRAGRAEQSPPILAEETLSTLIERHRCGMFDHTFQHVVDWGLGFVLDSNAYGPETVPYGYGRHCSPQIFGHSGAQSSTGFADPQHDLVVAWVLNGTPGEKRHQQRTRALNSAIYEDLGLTHAS